MKNIMSLYVYNVIDRWKWLITKFVFAYFVVELRLELL
jgi:hypothetical protein